MQRFLLVFSILTLLCLVPVADLLHARQPPPAAEKKEEALKRLEQLAKELDEFEQRISEERIKARRELVEKEQHVRTLDRAQTLQSQPLATEVQKLEKQLKEIEEVTVPSKEPNRIVVALNKKIKELHIEQENLTREAGVAREELMVAEEKFLLLERRHENQRHFLNLKIELVEQELFGKSDGADRRKQEKLEKALETIQRDLGDLRRKIETKEATKP